MKNNFRESVFLIANIVLGINIDTQMWIDDLKLSKSDNIFILDYDYFDEPNYQNGITYLSPLDAKEYFRKFDTLFYYKSMYVYPGMNGRSSSKHC